MLKKDRYAKNSSVEKKASLSKAIVARAQGVRLLILDVDGVLTNGGIIFDSEGRELKVFHVRDGHGIKLLRRNGVDVAIITGRQSDVVDIRARELGIEHVYQKCFNKIVAYEDIRKHLSLEDDQIAFVGDDIVDIPVMRRVGFAVAVADAHAEVRRAAHHVTEAEGGRCAVREVCEIVLKAKGLWKGILNGYLEV